MIDHFMRLGEAMAAVGRPVGHVQYEVIDEVVSTNPNPKGIAGWKNRKPEEKGDDITEVTSPLSDDEAEKIFQRAYPDGTCYALFTSAI